MTKFVVDVTQKVEVEFDETKFDETFMEEFRNHFFPFFDLSDHAEHLAQLTARGVINEINYVPEFIEGYGPSAGMGIKTRVVETEIDLVKEDIPGGCLA